MSRPAIGFKQVVVEPLPTIGLPTSRKVRYARWDGQPMRCPKKGELYLSGAIVVAYRAKADLTTEYFIAIEVTE